MGAQSAQAVTPTTVGLGTADSYEVLAATTVTNTLATVVNDGDVGLFPGTAVVGFPPGVINNGVIHAAGSQAEQAQADIDCQLLWSIPCSVTCRVWRGCCRWRSPSSPQG
jgi:hypothetical protein